MATLLFTSAAQAAWAQPPAAPPSPVAATAPAETAPSPAPAPSPSEAYVPSGAGPSVASPPAAGLRPPMSGPTVRLRTNNSRARLQQQLELSWTDVCAAPCGRTVDPNGTYRLGGGSLRASDPFRMPRPAGVVLVQGKMGSNVKHGVGLGLTIAGALDAAGGIITVALARNATGSFSKDLSNKDYYTVVGVSSIVTGAVLLGVGAYLLSSGSSSVEVQ